MRLLVLSWEYPPVIEGGLARHVRKLSEALVAQGAEVHVLSRGEPGLARSERRRGVQIHRVQEVPRPQDLDRFIAWVEQMNEDMLRAGSALGEQLDFDLVAGHDWLVAVAGERLAMRFGAPLVMTVHATEYGRHQGYVDGYPQRLIHATERWIAGRAERIIACSHYMRDHIVDVFSIAEERVSVIPNGIDPLDLKPVDELDALRARFAAPDEKLILLVGRLVYEKGFQVALQALAPIIERLTGVRFIVAGSGTYEAQLRERARSLGLSEHGHFLGWIGDDVLHSLYRIADLCVVPSLYEPFGLVALEAMASGCPCIVADTGGLREVVPPGERVGLRFNGGDPEHLSAMIERLLTDSALRERLVAEASEHVLRFDWGDVARQTRALYAELLEHGAHARQASSRALTG
jgi:glycogen(starch) synthase